MPQPCGRRSPRSRQASRAGRFGCCARWGPGPPSGSRRRITIRRAAAYGSQPNAGAQRAAPLRSFQDESRLPLPSVSPVTRSREMPHRPHYYDHDDLPRFGEIERGAAELARKFFDWYGAVFAEGALSAREKSLIALAVAHAVQCPYCIDAYSKDALEKGSNLDQMTEAVHVAAAIRGGASLVHGIQMRNQATAVGM